MRFSVLALDYDGTIAVDGALEPDVRRAIGDARARGITVLLVSGRILSELRDVAGDLAFVDAVVAENGAVVAFPATGTSIALAPPPPARLVDELRRARIDVGVGEAVIEADAAAAPIALSIVHALELPQVLLFNRNRLMILPSGVSKATGLRETLRMLRKSAHNAIGIGDAENDHELLDACELGVAVAWGSATLRAKADEVIAGTGPQAVAAFIQSAIREPQLSPSRSKRRQVMLARGATSAPTPLRLGGGNLLIAGERGTGKSRMVGALAEQFMLQRYSTCVVDMKGEHARLDVMPGVVLLGGQADGPALAGLRALLRHPDLNVVLNLSTLSGPNRAAYLRELLAVLTDTRRVYGVPHRIVLDGADFLLEDQQWLAALDLASGGYVLTTSCLAQLAPSARSAMESIVTTGMAEVDDRTVPAANSGVQF